MELKRITHSDYLWHFDDNNNKVLDSELEIHLEFFLDDSTATYLADLELKPGFTCAGMGFPSVLRCILPNWKNADYDAVAFLLQALYDEKGYFVLCRIECDFLVKASLLYYESNPIVRLVYSHISEFFLGYRLSWGMKESSANSNLSAMTFHSDW